MVVPREADRRWRVAGAAHCLCPGDEAAWRYGHGWPDRRHHLVAAPKQRNTGPEKYATKGGGAIRRSGPMSLPRRVRRIRMRAGQSSWSKKDLNLTVARGPTLRSQDLPTRSAARTVGGSGFSTMAKSQTVPALAAECSVTWYPMATPFLTWGRHAPMPGFATSRSGSIVPTRNRAYRLDNVTPNSYDAVGKFSATSLNSRALLMRIPN